MFEIEEKIPFISDPNIPKQNPPSTDDNSSIFSKERELNNLSLEEMKSIFDVKFIDPNPSNNEKIQNVYLIDGIYKKETVVKNDKIEQNNKTDKNEKSQDQNNASNTVNAFTNISYKSGNDEYICKKRGRAPRLIPNKKSSKSEHDKLSKDNILRKIQVHYISFLVKYVNRIIKTKLKLDKKYLFSDLSYSFKSNVSKKFMQSLKSITIGDLLKNKASSKHKKIDPNLDIENDKIYEKVYNSDEGIAELLKINYLYFFQQVYASFLFEKNTELTKKYKIPKTIHNFEKLITCELENDEVNGKKYVNKIREVCKNEFEFNVKKFIIK